MSERTHAFLMRSTCNAGEGKPYEAVGLTSPGIARASLRLVILQYQEKRSGELGTGQASCSRPWGSSVSAQQTHKFQMFQVSKVLHFELCTLHM